MGVNTIAICHAPENQETRCIHGKDYGVGDGVSTGVGVTMMSGVGCVGALGRKTSMMTASKTSTKLPMSH